MSTQLRLLTKADAPTPAAARARTARTGSDAASARPLRGRATTARRPARGRAVHWAGQWRLDERTREIGRAGVASARAALAAHRDDGTDLRRAS